MAYELGRKYASVICNRIAVIDVRWKMSKLVKNLLVIKALTVSSASRAIVSGNSSFDASSFHDFACYPGNNAMTMPGMVQSRDWTCA